MQQAEAGEPPQELSVGSAEAEKPVQEATSTPLEEPFAGNVSQCTPLPAEVRTGRKGFLQFDACFEGGDEIGLPLATIH